jgi:hypothetical protein
MLLVICRPEGTAAPRCRVLRRIFRPNKKEAEENCDFRSSITCTLYQVLLG